MIAHTLKVLRVDDCGDIESSIFCWLRRVAVRKDLDEVLDGVT